MKKSNSLVIFDNNNPFCNRLIGFIYKNDVRDEFFYSFINSNLSEILFRRNNIPFGYSKFILITDNRFYFGFDALIRILIKFGGLWNTLILAKALPIRIKEKIFNSLLVYKNSLIVINNKPTLFPEIYSHTLE